MPLHLGGSACGGDEPGPSLWLVAEIPSFQFRTAKRIVAGMAFTLAGPFLIIAAYGVSSDRGSAGPDCHRTVEPTVDQFGT